MRRREPAIVPAGRAITSQPTPGRPPGSRLLRRTSRLRQAPRRQGRTLEAPMGGRARCVILGKLGNETAAVALTKRRLRDDMAAARIGRDHDEKARRHRSTPRRDATSGSLCACNLTGRIRDRIGDRSGSHSFLSRQAARCRSLPAHQLRLVSARRPAPVQRRNESSPTER